MELPVGLLEVELGEEGLVGLQVLPARGIEGLPIDREVPVGLARAAEAEGRRQLAEVRGEIAPTAEPLRHDADALGQPVSVVPMGAVGHPRWRALARTVGRAPIVVWYIPVMKAERLGEQTGAVV